MTEGAEEENNGMMQLFYNKNIDNQTKLYTFDKEESRHIARVLRKKEGDIIRVTNGRNQVFTGEIIDANDKKCRISITKVETQESIRNYQMRIAIAPTKNNARLEWFLEKATEIGIDHIYPILCEHSERKHIKEERLQKHLQTAMKQSLQTQLPQLHPMGSFECLVKDNKTTQKFIARCSFTEEDARKNHLILQAKPHRDTLVLIGPEGGFSEREIDLALSNGFIPVSLGMTRLRTETAALVAVHTINIKNIYEKE